MPSPTSSTRPSSRTSSLARYWSISDCSTETISSALNLITTSRDDLVANILQLGLDGFVIEPIADAYDQAAEQIRVCLRFQQRFLVQGRAQLLAQAFLLIVRQRHRAPDLNLDASSPLVEQFLVGGNDRVQHVQALMVVEHQEEVKKQIAGPAGEDGVQDRGLAFAVHGATGQECLKLRICLEH